MRIAHGSATSPRKEDKKVVAAIAAQAEVERDINVAALEPLVSKDAVASFRCIMVRLPRGAHLQDTDDALRRRAFGEVAQQSAHHIGVSEKVHAPLCVHVIGRHPRRAPGACQRRAGGFRERFC